MKIVNIVIVVLITVLSIAAGFAKVMQVPEEMAFLQGLGLSSTLIVIFGLVQIVGGLGLVLVKTRLFGAILTTLGFAISAVLIFVDGNLSFGLFSLLPVALAGSIIYQSLSGKKS